jgi:protein gp37
VGRRLRPKSMGRRSSKGAFADPPEPRPGSRTRWGSQALSDPWRTVVTMADRSPIEWTEATWNPVTGCTKTSPGCDHCYALHLAKRLKAMGNPRYQRDGDSDLSGPGFGLQLHEDLLDLPRTWKRPRNIFVNSMSDLFQHEVPEEFINRVFAVMTSLQRHRFQVLTKRSKRLAVLAPNLAWAPNIWMGVSVESVAYRFRIDHLRSVPAHVRFLSLEPLLGPLDALDLRGIHWVIVGGESGLRARPLDPAWVRSIRDQCLEQDVPFFFKQWGGRTSKAGGRSLDNTEHNEMPA